MNGLLMAIALLISSATGAGVVHAFWPEKTSKNSMVFRAALSVAIGLAVHACVGFLWLSLALEPVALWCLDVITMFLSLCGCFVIRRKKIASQTQQNASENFSDDARVESSRWVWILHAALVCIVPLIALAAWGDALRRPHGWWDAISFWNMKARFFFRGGELWARALTQVDPGRHTDYPLLLPINLCRLWVYVGSEVLVAGNVLAVVFALALLGLLWGGLCWLRSPGAASAATITLLATSAFVLKIGDQVADVPLSVFILGVCVLLVAQREKITTSNVFLFLAGVCAGGAVWTKNEGSLFILVVIAAIFLTEFTEGNLRKFPAKMRDFLTGATAWIVCLVLMKSTLAGKSDVINSQSAALIFQKLWDVNRYQQILSFSVGILGLAPDAMIIAILLVLGLLAKINESTTGSNPIFKRVSICILLVLPATELAMTLYAWLNHMATAPTQMGYAINPMFVKIFMVLSAACTLSLFILVMLCTFGRGAKNAAMRPAVLIIMGMIGGYALVYLITPHDLLWHLSTSIERLFFHLWPSMLLLIFMTLPTPESIFFISFSQSKTNEK